MAGPATLREYCIRLGFKIDQSQERNFNESMNKVAKSATDIVKAFAKIGAATVAGMTASGFALKKMSDGLSGLYYSAQRTSSSAKELKVLQYGFEQIGLSAEDAQSSVEALAAARRQNPGLNGLLSGLGVKPDVDNAKVLVDLLGKLRGMAPYMRAQYASMFGLNEGAVNQLELNGPAFAAALKRREALFRKEGYNPDAAAKKAVEFERAWNDAKARYSDMAQEMAVKLLPIAERFIGILERTADWLLKVDKSTGGWVTNLGALGIALAPILAALKISGAGALLTKGLGSILGRGAAAGVAGGVAEGGAGLLSLISLPVVIVAAVAAALVWMGAHPEQVRKAAGAAWDWTKKTAATAGEDIKAGVKAINQSGGWAKSLSMMPGMIGDLARMTGKFEGFSKKVYNDVAGNATFGIGHKLKPGESMEGVDPISLFMSDLKNSLSVVMRSVKGKVSQNQIKALADLEFNIGEGNFRNSTLLRKLNAGDQSGAAAEFKRWNHVLQNGHLVSNNMLTWRRAQEEQMFRTPDKQVTINAPTTIHVDGSDSPRETAREIGRQQNRVYGDMVRNFQGIYQ